MEKITLIILASGKGERIGLKTPKQYLQFHGKEMLRYCIESFQSYTKISDIIVVINKDDIELYQNATKDLGLLHYVIGGNSRQDSLKNAILYLQKNNKPNKVLVHDACRPFVSHDILDNLFAENNNNYACIFPAIPVRDSMIEVKESQYLFQDRQDKFLIQTPQLLDYKIAVEIFNNHNHTQYNDESSLFVSYNKKVKMVNGEISNFKITHPEDLNFASLLLRKNKDNMVTKIGIGYDVHRFKENDNLEKDKYIILGGIKIPHTKYIEAHSDGDVLLHAITDALFGAIADGDIGEHFPPTDIKWKNADSKIFIEYACEKVRKLGGKIVNIDVVIACEKPKITPYKTQIKENIANMMQINAANIGIKATTTEKLGSIGREEGISVQAIANIIINNNEV
jgi:2-C-methyl-D-erythritol 4-phosphate cytidylyltransferase / 2-C-methyl-D-erythritol 2,4-cyclodiphosphate synthase